MKRKYLSILAGLMLGMPHLASAQQDYPTLSELNNRLQAVGRNQAAELQSLAKTEGGKDIWVLRLGKGDLNNKPAIAVTGGVEGHHLLGVEMAVRFAEKVVADHQDLLEQTTFYVFPNMSPDAYAQYFANVKYERRGNAAQVDQDRDGSVSEDPYEDLNRDGYITMMRVESPVGDYQKHHADERVMVKADRAKGQRGGYLYFTEGIDNDKDGRFNEDLEEGIAFNKSMTYKFPAFDDLAGDIPVEQVETRALVDYLFDRFNIFAFVTFGPANNLSAPLKYNAGDAKKRIVTSMLENDVKINSMVSDIYKETVSQKAHQQDNQGTPGDFFQWAYFHFGRLSFSTPGWWVPEMKQEGKDFQDKQVNFLAWAEEEGMEDVFVDWQQVDHPDFPGQKVEVGGVKPFVLHNPPYEKVNAIVDEHVAFIAKLAEMQPRLEFHNVKTEKLGNGLTRVTADLYNNSPLPTHSEMGERSRWLNKIRVDVSKDKKDLIAGDKIALIDKMDAFGTQTMTWIVRGGGNLDVKAGAAHTGFATLNLKL